MKTRMIKSLLTASISILAMSANAASIEQSHCTLSAAPAGGTSASVQTVSFGSPKVNAVGAIERTAAIGSTTATLGEAGEDAYITIQDAKGKVYFAASFKDSALYATPKFTVQVTCKGM